jgi:hypothetical protein
VKIEVRAAAANAYNSRRRGREVEGLIHGKNKRKTIRVDYHTTEKSG